MDVLMRVQGKGESIKIVYTDGKLCMEVDTPRELKLARKLLPDARKLLSAK